MYHRHILIISSMLLVSSFSAYSETVVERSFETLRQTPRVCPEQFTFVVVGDSQPTEPGELPPVFFRMMEEWNCVKPAFVMSVGDLILGGSAEGLPKQWADFTNAIRLGLNHIPFFPAPGNHDISDKNSEDIYKSEIGPTCYAFSYGNARFIVLNSEEPGQVDSFSEIQKVWLQKELAKVTEKHIFVFLHKPYFVNPEHQGWNEIAQMLKPFKSVYVFAGHDHRYLNVGKRDNIQYVITGGGGGPIRKPPEEGGFHHYLLVRVENEEVSWSVIKPGFVESSDIVTKEKIELWNQWRDAFQIPTIEWDWGNPIHIDVPMKITNPSSDATTIEIQWDSPPSWTVTPSNSKIPLGFDNTNNTATVRISMSRNEPSPKLYPVPTANIVIPLTEGNYSLNIPFPIVPSIGIPYTDISPTIDGNLYEWETIPSYPLLYPVRFEPSQNTQDLQASWQCSWNEKGLYMAVTVYDNEFVQPYAGDIVWCADNLELFLGVWEWSLTLTEHGPEVFLYEGPGREEETVNTVVQLAVVRNEPYTYYEAYFPPSELTPLLLEAYQKITFSLIANDLDKSGDNPKRHWLEFTPDAGSGEDDFPRAILVLQPSKM